MLTFNVKFAVTKPKYDYKSKPWCFDCKSFLQSIRCVIAVNKVVL